MINPAPAIRKAFYDLLNGAVSYESAAVPVYEGRGQVGKDYQVLITDTTAQQTGVRGSYSWAAQQLIEVVTEKATSNPMLIVDTIGQQVMNLIKPEPGVNPLAATDFKFDTPKLLDISNRRERSDINSQITILYLRYSFNVHQK